MEFQLFWHYLLKRLFSPLNCLCTFVHNQLTVFEWVYFWAFYSIPLIYMSIFLPKPHHHVYCNFIVSLKISQEGSSKIVLILLIILAIVVPLPFYIIFRHSWSVSSKNPGDIFYWYCVKSIGQFGGNRLLLSLPIHEHSMCFYLLSYLIFFSSIGQFSAYRIHRFRQYYACVFHLIRAIVNVFF